MPPVRHTGIGPGNPTPSPLLLANIEIESPLTHLQTVVPNSQLPRGAASDQAPYRRRDGTSAFLGVERSREPRQRPLRRARTASARNLRMSFGRPVLVYLREPCCRCTWHRYYRRHLHHGERTPLRAPRSYRTAAPCNRGQGDHMANASSLLIEDVDRREFARLQKLVNPRPGYS